MTQQDIQTLLIWALVVIAPALLGGNLGWLAYKRSERRKASRKAYKLTDNKLYQKVLTQ